MVVLAEVTEHASGETEQPVSEDSDIMDEQHIKEACDELRDYFNHRLMESLLRSTRHSLDVMRRRFFSGLVKLFKKF